MLKIYLIVCFTLLTVIASADTIPGIKRIQQEKDEWCWVAATLCLVKYWDPSCTKTQTQIASVITTQNIAPDPPLIEKCIEENGKNVNLQVDTLLRPMTWLELKAEIDAKRPFYMLIRWTSGGYHSNICAGYIKDSTRIRFMDPLGSSWADYSYSGLFNIWGRGKWERTFKTRSGNTNYINNNNFNHSPNNTLTIIYNPHHQPYQGVTFLLQTTSTDNKMLRIYDALGACMYSSSVEGRTARTTWEQSVTSGMYYVTVEKMNAPEIILRKSFNLVK